MATPDERQKLHHQLVASLAAFTKRHLPKTKTNTKALFPVFR